MHAQAQTSGEVDAVAGLITVHTDAWVDHLAMIRVRCATLVDGMRYRDVKVVVASTYKTEVLDRKIAGDRGEPHRDLLPNPET